MRSQSRLRKAAQLVVALCLTNGCAAWRTVQKEQLTQAIQNRDVGSVRVTQDGEWMRVYRPHISGDSLIGSLKSDDNREDVSLLIDSIHSGQVRSVNPAGSAMLGGSAAILLVYLLTSTRVPPKP